MAISEVHPPQVFHQLTLPDSPAPSSSSPIVTLDAVRRFLAEADDLNELLEVRRQVGVRVSSISKRKGLHEAQNELAEAKRAY